MSADWAALTVEQRARWATVLDYLVAAVPGGGGLVAVEGTDGRAALVAEWLADRLRHDGRPVVRLDAAAPDGEAAHEAQAVVVADGPHWRDHAPGKGWQVTVWVRTGGAAGYRGDDAHAVVDLHDPGWPVLRHVDRSLMPAESWYRTESRAFFGARAGTWDAKFGADLPAYTAAVAGADLTPGGIVVDVGCGTGRALAALRAATGPDGLVIGLDHTPQMLAAARVRAAACAARLVLADARCLPFAAGTVDAVFAAGLINHLPDHDTALAELARVTRPGGRLVLFHPSGRAALAARHGRALRPEEPLAEHVLRASADRTGWQLTSYDDSPHRFYAVAERLPTADA